MKHLYGILLLALVSSCMSLEKAVDKVTANETSARVASLAIKEKHPIVPASFHKVWYPVVPTIITKVDSFETLVTVPGDSIECPEQSYVPSNTGTKPLPKPKPVYVKCPDVSYLQTTIKEYTTQIEENTAALDEKNLELDQKNKQIHDLEQANLAKDKQIQQEIDEAKPFKWIVYIIGFLLLLGIVLKFTRFV